MVGSKPLADVFADPQVISQDMMLEVEHSGDGPVRMTGFPIKLSATLDGLHRLAPAPSEHTDEVLRELGYDAERVAGLKDRGIISASRP